MTGKKPADSTVLIADFSNSSVANRAGAASMIESPGSNLEGH
jgi:hypothetical protein